jgi:hypothetical protein
MNTLRSLGMLTALGVLSVASTQALAEQGAATAQATPPTTETQPNTSPDADSAASPHQKDVTAGQGVSPGSDDAPPPVEDSDPTSAASPHQRDAVQGPAGANERAAGKDKQMAGATKPKDKLVGLPVETSSGQQLGSVVDIVRDKAGTPTYAVIAIDNDTAAVPYDTATAMIHNGKVVMTQAKLSGAPKVKQSEWLDQASSTWRTQADKYWGSTRTASPGDVKKPAER